MPASILWQYYVDPEKRLRWQPPGQTAIENTPNEDGRLGAGASSHCAHGIMGDILREYIDWRPFRYFTNRMTPIGKQLAGRIMLQPWVETTEFIPLDDGVTAIRFRIRIQSRGWLARVRFWLSSRFMRAGQSRMREAFRRALAEDGVLAEEGTKSKD